MAATTTPLTRERTTSRQSDGATRRERPEGEPNTLWLTQGRLVVGVRLFRHLPVRLCHRLVFLRLCVEALREGRTVPHHGG